MSLASYRLLSGAVWSTPALILAIGCSGGATTDPTPQAASPPVTSSAATSPAAASPTPMAVATPTAPPTAAVTATYDRYANPAPRAAGPKPVVEFNDESFRAAAADKSVVGDRYSR
ncbi:hypothetical protein Pla108_28390 [Botrimarina colliarenosi]|uniref:Uncharacterized protein n=1 Tax=Botrimarina colliarenosi TaxID=2528001 RepID=A0A5C6AAJ5_9BACT|nr:hypothetical protein [Botrimarina colliarenosi]TWT97062.1 hypothetical protein Pla108_28390 [Botrimarina colliarenosi]